MFCRGDFASPGSPPEAEMGADVEVDCREGTNEHAVHLPGRPGIRHTNTHPHTQSSQMTDEVKAHTKYIQKLCLQRFFLTQV